MPSARRQVPSRPIASAEPPSEPAADFFFLSKFCSVQSLSRDRLFATPWTAACQASLSITSSQSLLKPMSIESVMPSNHLILCRPFSSRLQSFQSLWKCECDPRSGTNRMAWEGSRQLPGGARGQLCEAPVFLSL